MRKGFTRNPRPDAPGSHGPNYITPAGLQRLKDEHRFLLTRERPAVTEVVTWAASNGDRSENADYQYGKRRLRQIDSRLRFLMKRIEAATVVDPEVPRKGLAAAKVFFGATVRYADDEGTERVVSIVGADTVVLHAPGGTAYLTVLEVRYERIEVEPFREPPGSEAAAKGRPPVR
jgi:transcription elongation factor GreB